VIANAGGHPGRLRSSFRVQVDGFGVTCAPGLGNWLECPGAKGPNTYNCGSGHRNSSAGAYGAYPFIDFDHHYFGILARQGELACAPPRLPPPSGPTVPVRR